MRFAILSALALAGSALADGEPARQIGDGQVQVPASSAAETPPSYDTTTVIPSPPLETAPVAETTPVPETTPVQETTPVVETSPVVLTTPTPETTTTPAAPVTTTTSPLVSYPVPGNTTAPLTTGAPVTTSSTTLTGGYGNPSATEGSPVSSETPPAANPNAAGIVGVHMGLTAAALTGLLVFLA